MTELANKFSISELQSILIHLQSGSIIASLIRELENPGSTLLNPSCNGKFKNMLPKLRTTAPVEEQTLRAFTNI